MREEITQLRVDGLTALQLAELRAAVTAADADCFTTLEGQKLTGGKVGEPVLLSVLIRLGPPVISAIALWLAKDKKRRTMKVKYKRIHANGSLESFDMEQSSSQEGESPSAALEAFLKGMPSNDRPSTS